MLRLTALRWGLVAALTLFTITAQARAGFINGSFESGNFTGWTTTGDTLVTGSGIGVTPIHGSSQAFLTTASNNGDFNNFSGSDAVSAAALESFLGLSAGTVGNGFEGSAIRQTVTVNAGDVLTFRYKFLTTEGSQTDFAFVTLTGYGILADTTADDFTASAVILDPSTLR